MKVYRLLFAAILLVVFSGLQSQTNLRQGKDFALFIAIDDYEEWTDLKYPIYEAATISKQLGEGYGFKTESLKNPTLMEINTKLSEYTEKAFADDSQLLIYFSGHGYFTSQTNEGFFIPKDGKNNDKYQYSYMPYSRLEKMIKSIPCPHILLMIDACYSGTFDEEIAQMRGKPSELPFGNNDLGNWRTFIQKRLQKKSRLLLTSGKKERTPDASNFAKKFDEILKNNLTQLKVLTFEEFTNDIIAISPQPYTATFEGHEEGGDFIFFPKGFEKKPAPMFEGELPKTPPASALEPCALNQTGEVCIENATKSSISIMWAGKKTYIESGSKECFSDLKAGTFSFRWMKAGPGWYEPGVSDSQVRVVACDTATKIIK